MCSALKGGGLKVPPFIFFPHFFQDCQNITNHVKNKKLHDYLYVLKLRQSTQINNKTSTPSGDIW